MMLKILCYGVYSYFCSLMEFRKGSSLPGFDSIDLAPPRTPRRVAGAVKRRRVFIPCVFIGSRTRHGPGAARHLHSIRILHTLRSGTLVTTSCFCGVLRNFGETP